MHLWQWCTQLFQWSASIPVVLSHNQAPVWMPLIQTNNFKVMRVLHAIWITAPLALSFSPAYPLLHHFHGYSLIADRHSSHCWRNTTSITDWKCCVCSFVTHPYIMAIRLLINIVALLPASLMGFIYQHAQQSTTCSVWLMGMETHGSLQLWRVFGPNYVSC